jgi:predicted P-loop ATPase
MEGTRKRRRPWKRWTDDFQEYLEIMGTINWREMARDRKGGRSIMLEGQGHNGL